jgi:hypothetical protein
VNAQAPRAAAQEPLFASASATDRPAADPSAPDADPDAALLFRAAPVAHPQGLLLLGAASLALGPDPHPGYSRNPTSDSRPPTQRRQDATATPVAPAEKATRLRLNAAPTALHSGERSEAWTLHRSNASPGGERGKAQHPLRRGN